MTERNTATGETPLVAVLREMIVREGPLTISQYMTTCLHHPVHGYYRAQNALGRDGDFTTAPEISQIFGELIGLWAAIVWQQMGAPERFVLAEAGPGRGTLMADALRATRKVPGFLAAADVRLIEVSPVLQAVQRQALSGASMAVRWHETFSDLPPDLPVILIANEFLDTLAIDQYVRTPDGVAMRVVDADAAGRPVFATRPPGDSLSPEIAAFLETAAPGAIFEVPAEDCVLIDMLAARRSAGVAALLIDYGHNETALGETLQAVRRHRYEDVLASPGEADLSAQVDFARVGAAARAAGLEVDGPVPQAAFLGQLGAIERASRLMAANPDKAGDVEAATMRLMAPGGMGTRFKAIGLRSSSVAPLPGFAASGPP